MIGKIHFIIVCIHVNKFFFADAYLIIYAIINIYSLLK